MGKSQQGVAQEFHISPSRVHYWMNGSVPRDLLMRKKIQKWSKGMVPAE
jgi:hypothetical protein